MSQTFDYQAYHTTHVCFTNATCRSVYQKTRRCDYHLQNLEVNFPAIVNNSMPNIGTSILI